MISRIYEGADGFQFFQSLSLLIFFVVFLGVIVLIVTMKKGYVDRMSNLPLDLEDEKSTNHGGHS
jgi:cbb3-type cytochrome oxidase subunit 3